MKARRNTRGLALAPKARSAPKPEKLVRVTVAKGLPMKDGIKAVWNAAKRKGKRDARAIGYDPKTGKGHAL